jgi:hypothetical protein
MRTWLVLSGMLVALSPFACGDSNTGTLTGSQHPPPGGPDGSSPGSGDDASDSGSSTTDDSSPIVDDGALTVGSPCDPSNNACPSSLMCCPVGGLVREGGVYNSCQNPALPADGGPLGCP